MQRSYKREGGPHAQSSFELLMRSRDKEADKEAREKENHHDNFSRTFKFSIHDQAKMS